MKVHPDADVFPRMTADEFDRLADDIEANGLVEPITTLDGAILDGRHRQRACDERGVEPIYVEWDPGCGLTSLEWVISKNLHRRQLNVSQRAALACELKERLAEAARKRKAEGGAKGGQKAGRGRPNRDSTKACEPYSGKRERRSDFIAARQFGIGTTSVVAVQQVRNEDPEVFERIKAGEITTAAARKEIGLRKSNGGAPGPATKSSLKDAIDPLRRYLKNWNEERFYGMTPAEARRQLKLVQEVSLGLFEVERALDERSVTSRALR